MTAAPSRLRLLLALVPLLTLTGCFDVLEELWLHPDGSAKLVVDLAVPKSLTGLAQLAGGKDLQAVVREQQASAEAEVRKDPNVTQLVLREEEKGDRVHFVYELSVKDATKLPQLYQRIFQHTSAGEGAPPGDWDFRLEREGGDYVFVRRLTPAAAGTGDRDSGDGTERAAREIGKGLARALLGDNHFTVIVHGPAILESNGTVNEKKDTVQWKLSLAELMDVPAEGRELRAVVSGGEPLWLWAVVLGVPLAVLGLAISAARRKRAAHAG
ncbi:MAG TPA: hypothetical protein VE153_28515 [Myxococcus sp.]|nr:hypothetical protein [Myxococcus sp.]